MPVLAVTFAGIFAGNSGIKDRQIRHHVGSHDRILDVFFSVGDHRKTP